MPLTLRNKIKSDKLYKQELHKTVKLKICECELFFDLIIINHLFLLFEIVAVLPK